MSGDREETAAFEALAAAYERAPNGRRVDVVIVEDEVDHLSKLAVASAGGDPPDVFVVGYRAYTALAGPGRVVAAGPELERRGVDLDAYAVAPVDAFTSAGELQCLPLNASSMVVYWNRALFGAAGVPAPKAGWTWSDFASASRRLTAGDVRGLGIAPRLIRLAPFVWSAGGEIVDEEAAPTTTTFSTPEGIESLQLLADLLRDGVIPSPAERRSQGLDTSFARGRLGMYLSSRRDVPRFRESTELDWDIAPVPTKPGHQPRSILHSDGACITKGNQQAAAADFVAFLAGRDAQSLAALSGRFVPPSSSARAAFLDPARPPASAQVFLDQLDQIRRVPVAPRWSSAETRADEILEKLWDDPSKPVADVAAEIDRETARVLRG